MQVNGALLVADQHLAWSPPPSLPSVTEAERTFAEQARQVCALHERDTTLPWAILGIRARASTPVAVHLRAAQRTLEQLDRRMQRDRESRQEVAWLSQNRHRFSGRWIALEGDQLLAVGDTSRQVFLQVADRPHPPLVIRIEDQDLPFAGW